MDEPFAATRYGRSASAAHELIAEDVQRVQFGQQLERLDGHPDAPLARVYEPGGQFLGLVKSREDGWQPHKVFLLET